MTEETGSPESQLSDSEYRVSHPRSEVADPQSSNLDSRSPTPVPPSALGWLWAVGWLGAAAVVFSLGFVPLRVSHDEWWHLKTGKWIVEHDWRLPRKDIFTYSAESYDWDNHEWLSQAVMFLAYRWGDDRAVGGWRAVIVLKTLVLIATYLLLGLFVWRRAGGGARGHAIAIFLVLVAAAAGRRTIWPRPPVVSYFFMIFFLYLLWMHRTGRLRTPWLFVLAVVMPLWANLHGGFVLGGIAVGAYAAGELGEWAIGRWIARRRTEDLRPVALRAGTYAAVGILCGCASLLTPFGYKLYLLTGRVMSSKDLVFRINELMPPDLRYTWAYVFLCALIAVGLAICLVASLRGAKNAWPPLADLLLVAFFFWQSANHVRHLPLFGLAAAPLAAWMLARYWGPDPQVPRSRRIKTELVGFSVVCGAWLVFFPGEFLSALKHMQRDDREERRGVLPSNFLRNTLLLRGMEIEPDSYPAEAVNFMLSARLPGRMFNMDRTAGYLIWHLSPERYKVFTDQRFDIFGGDFLMDEIAVSRGAPPNAYIKPYDTPLPYWRDVIDKWRINWLFLSISEEVNEILVQPDSGWALVYADPGYLIWLKRDVANQPWIDRYERPARTRQLRELLGGIAGPRSSGANADGPPASAGSPSLAGDEGGESR